MVPSLPVDSTLRPAEIIAVDVIALLWPLNVLTEFIRVGRVEFDSGRSAGRILRAKSTPEVRRTFDEGKKRSDVIALTLGLLVE